MKSIDRITLLALALLPLLMIACRRPGSATELTLEAPSGELAVTFRLGGSGEPEYLVHHGDEGVIEPSPMGFQLIDQPDMRSGFTLESVSRDTVDHTWELPWGEQRVVRDQYNQVRIRLKENEDPFRVMELVFRAYDEGIAFRYHLPGEQPVQEMVIGEELTGFNLTADHQAWWIPGDWDSYEHRYNHTRISAIDAPSKADPALNTCTIPENAVHTPLTMMTGTGTYLAIHEANLTDYASMTLLVDTAGLALRSGLVDSERFGYAVKRTLPFSTPWRTIQVAESPGALIESNLVLNLNEPNRLEDVNWIRPMTYAGIWWEMHLGKSGWDMEGGRHGATTENARRYINFAAAHNLGGVLVEGWNTGWDRWTGSDREGVFDFVTPYPDYDLKEVAAYAKKKGVELIMHHETSAAPRTYERQLDTAFSLMQELDIHNAKLGYVGKIIPDGEHHHGQWMVNHYRRVVETAAAYQVAVNIHEPVKPTGLRRTYPNLLAAEGVRGQEFNAWSPDGGNPTDHLTVVPFTRMLAGPIDYTPGIVHLSLDPYRPQNRVKTTLAHQLALYVVIHSPVQMAADLPEHYLQHPEALRFISSVGVDWEQSVVPEGAIGEYIVVAREERLSGKWFLGAITDEQGRSLDLDFSFLEEGTEYRAEIYRDGDGAGWKENPLELEVESVPVNRNSEININLAPGGGVAMCITPVSQGDES